MTQDKLFIYSLYAIRKGCRKMGLFKRRSEPQYLKYVEYSNQAANDYVYEVLKGGKPCLISKFGTIELNAIIAYLVTSGTLTLPLLKKFLYGEINLSRILSINALYRHAGFFPATEDMGKLFVKRMLNDIREIDVLGSYIENESYLDQYLKNCTRINLDGYYAPFLWDKPWTRILKDKRVLVVHPFVESIKAQYENNRALLFKNPDVLPEFKELILVKAVQSIGGTETKYKDWFEALDSMEEEIHSKNFDIALIGCGAYGMPLAAFVKRMGKQAVHLAGWTQMLFGIYGKRWLVDQPYYQFVINDYWSRPTAEETPKAAKNVEGGCYW